MDRTAGADGICWSDRIGSAGLYVLLLCFQLNATVAFIGWALTLAAFLPQAPAWWPRLKNDAVAILFLAVMACVIASAGWAAAAFPETRGEQWKAAFNWLECLIFIPVAWAARNHLQRFDRLLLLFGAGVLLRILSHGQWSHLDRFFSWERTGFGLNPIAMGLYAGLCILGLAILAPRLLRPQPVPRARMAAAGLGALALFVFLEAFFLSQSRGAWLAATLAFPPALIYRYRVWLRQDALTARGLILLAALAVAGGALLAQNAGFIQQRMEQPQAAGPAQPAREDLAAASTGYRLALWKLGLQKWQERPWLGWGAGTTEFIIEQAHEPALTGKDGEALFSHLHNTYLEVLLRFGSLGAILFAGLPALLLLGLRRACRAGPMPEDHACLLLGAWAFTLLWSFFDFRFFHHEWRNYCVILAALSYAWMLGIGKGPERNPLIRRRARCREARMQSGLRPL